jgi:hypothetical protein
MKLNALGSILYLRTKCCRGSELVTREMYGLLNEYDVLLQVSTT